jgi:hypothetical protein
MIEAPLTLEVNSGEVNMQDVLEASRLKKLYEKSSITFISIFMVK